MIKPISEWLDFQKTKVIASGHFSLRCSLSLSLYSDRVCVCTHVHAHTESLFHSLFLSCHLNSAGHSCWSNSEKEGLLIAPEKDHLNIFPFIKESSLHFKREAKCGWCNVLPCGHLNWSAHFEVCSTLLMLFVSEDERFLLMPTISPPFIPSANNR